MNLRGIVAVSGRPGLFRLVGQNKAGYVLESLDAQRTKIVTNISTTKLASLEDITVYGEEEDLKLTDIFADFAASGKAIPEGKAEAAELRNFFAELVPNHDQSKVYTSDMKKIVTWYHIIKDLPLFTEAPLDAEGTEVLKAAEEKVEKKTKAAPKPSNAKAPSRAAQPAKKANMTSKKGV